MLDFQEPSVFPRPSCDLRTVREPGPVTRYPGICSSSFFFFFNLPFAFQLVGKQDVTTGHRCLPPPPAVHAFTFFRAEGSAFPTLIAFLSLFFSLTLSHFRGVKCLHQDFFTDKITSDGSGPGNPTPTRQPMRFENLRRPDAIRPVRSPTPPDPARLDPLGLLKTS